MSSHHLRLVSMTQRCYATNLRSTPINQINSFDLCKKKSNVRVHSAMTQPLMQVRVKTDNADQPISRSLIPVNTHRYPFRMMNMISRLPRHVYGGETPKASFEIAPFPSAPVNPTTIDEVETLPDSFTQYISGYVFCTVNDIKKVCFF